MKDISKKSINSEIIKFIKSENKTLPMSDLNNNTNLFEQGYLDSFGLVQLILFIEKTYKVNISDADFFEKQNSSNSITDYILKKIK